MRTIAVEIVETTLHGHRVQVNPPIIPADASPELREALGRRRTLALTGTCPCGATKQPPTPAQLAPGAKPFRSGALHDTDCTASPVNLEHAVRAWQRQETG